MPIPVYYNAGFVSIYGAGSSAGVNGIKPTQNFLFGVIDQTWGSIQNLSQGDSVMFDSNDIVVRLVYSNQTYTIIKEEKIILKEILPP